MLKVREKSTRKLFGVYDITYDKSGYPHFLIYKDAQWLRVSAKHFEPMGWNCINENIELLLSRVRRGA